MIVFLPLVATSILLAQTPTHGTINVLLANGNGMVLVTDSRASDPYGHPLNDRTRKLFKIDALTVCTIAGFGYDPGPGNAIRESTGGEVSSLIEGLKKTNQTVSFRDKVLLFTATLGARLSTLETEYEYAKKTTPPRLTPQGLTMLFAGDDTDGRQLMGKVTITIKRVTSVSSHVEFKPEVESEILPVGPNLTYLTAGADTTVQDRLMGPGAFPEEKELSDYAQAFHNGRTSDLSVEQMQKLALYLKAEAGTVYKYVGGPAQQATFDSSKFQIVNPENLLPDLPPYATAILSFDSVDDMPLSLPVSGSPHTVFLNDFYRNAAVLLDDMTLIGGIYRDCNFFYDGGNFYVDPSVEIHGGKLVLGKHVPMGSYLAQKASRAFPELKAIPYTDLPNAEAIAKQFWP